MAQKPKNAKASQLPVQRFRRQAQADRASLRRRPALNLRSGLTAYLVAVSTIRAMIVDLPLIGEHRPGAALPASLYVSVIREAE